MKFPRILSSKSNPLVHTGKDLLNRSGSLFNKFQETIDEANQINAEIEDRKAVLQSRIDKAEQERNQLDKQAQRNQRMANRIEEFFFSDDEEVIEEIIDVEADA